MTIKYRVTKIALTRDGLIEAAWTQSRDGGKTFSSLLFEAKGWPDTDVFNALTAIGWFGVFARYDKAGSIKSFLPKWGTEKHFEAVIKAAEGYIKRLDSVQGRPFIESEATYQRALLLHPKQYSEAGAYCSCCSQ